MPSADASPPGQPRRLTEVDALRGLAVLGVVVYHFGLPFAEFFPGRRGWYHFPQGAYGVELFFMISGFVILMTARRSRLISDFVIARATRLYPAYWAALTLTLVAIVATGRPPMLNFTTSQAAVNYTMFQRFFMVADIDRVYWTLAIELVFYFYIFVLMLLTRNRLTARVLRVFVAAWLVAALAVAWWMHGADLTTERKILTSVVAAQFAPFFSTGVLAHLSRERKKIEWLLVPSVALVFVNTHLMVGLEAAVISLVLAALFLFVVLGGSCAPLRWRPLAWCGEISYALYLVHMNIGWIIINRLRSWLSRPWATVWAFVAVVTLAWLLHVTVEVPISRRLRAWCTRARDRLRSPAAGPR